MNAAFYVLSFVIALSVLVAVHELGHFLAARICGVKVLRFSLGFGRPIRIWRLGADQTEWALSMIPLGGYVRMLDEREGEVLPSERHRSFNAQSLLKRSFIVFAGPLANFVLAIAISWVLACAGTRDLPAVIGQISPGSVMQQAGVLPGDRVLSVNRGTVRSWSEFNWHVIGQVLKNEKIVLGLERKGGALLRTELDSSSVNMNEKGGSPLLQLGARPFLPELRTIVGTLVEGSPAIRAGFQPGDRVLKVGEKRLASPEEFVALVSRSSGKTLAVTVLRGAQERILTVVPVSTKPGGQAMIGIGIAPDEEGLKRVSIEIRDGVLEGLWSGIRQTSDMTLFSVRALGKLVTGSISARTVSGPLTIADYAGQSASMGLGAYLRFLALLSVSVGVLNLLPVPILDGGHLLYHAAEFVRGRPLSVRAEEWGFRIGMVLLGCLMALAFFNDFNRFFFG